MLFTIRLLFIVTEYDGNIFINKEHMKKRFEFNYYPSYIYILTEGDTLLFVSFKGYIIHLLRKCLP